MSVFGDRFSYIREGRAMVFLRVAVFGDRFSYIREGRDCGVFKRGAVLGNRYSYTRRKSLPCF